MTLVSSIIRRAFRETNIIAVGAEPSEAEYAEGLERLQVLVLSVLGNEAGENLNPVPLGRNDITSPAGYPWYNNNLPGNAFFPVNSRLMLNLTDAGTAIFNPRPDDGARMGVVDVSKNLESFNLTISGNGQSIEGSPTLVLDEDGISRQWFYREDLGDWVRVDPLDLDSIFPYPTEFEDFFIIMLAMRINPAFGTSLSPESQAAFSRARTQFRARYLQDIQVKVEDALLFLSGDYRYGGRFINRAYYGDATALFDTGYPFPY